MPIPAAPPENLPGVEAGAEEDEEKERADAEVRQFPDHVLRDKMVRAENAIKVGLTSRLRDGGKKLRASLDAIRRELARRKQLSEAPRPPGGVGGPGARAQDEKGCERVVRSRCAESSGMARDANIGKVTKADFLCSFGNDLKAGVDISSLKITSRRPDKSKKSVKNEGKLCQEKNSCKSSSQTTNSSREELYLDNSANMEKISSDDSPKDNGHDRMCTPAPTPSRKRKGDASADFSMRLRSRKGEVVLLDGDTPHPESAEETSNKWSAGKLYYPTRDHPDSIEISSDDIRCLEPESLLSSPIMNFYMMYLQGPTSSTVRPRGDYHIFNTYFYSKLAAMTSKEDKTTYFLKLRRWWKSVDIFQKAYIFLPVHAETHWSLVIICMPAKDDQTGPIILHLDSLKFHCSRLIFNVVTRFLKEEWSYLNENASSTEFPLRETVWKSLPRKIEKKKIEVPQQENDYDCGLFVLYYIQRFIQEAPERFHKKDISMFNKRWFKPEEPSQLRHEIRHLIFSCGDAEPKEDATERTRVEVEPKDGLTQASIGEAESKNDATKPSCGKAEAKNGTTDPLCREAESKKCETEPRSEFLSGAVDVAPTEVHISV
ncbi:hypothetical protein EJB05_44856 [Eragrostis curvula]|uniref:Ubiquitin-like protease family profile domain-containing protein n=1 Tax=Eragrostis curvula TaxID=38414 RepID=A0A5J9TKR3_9POAL|nr:hypothetical protein EJB05_44856 [Eragrostis curvula]